ncbi:MAG: chalcone isomerase family protein, partial [Betaproteobacteria bacterium]
SEVTAQDLISSMNNALAVNLSPHELALIEKRIRDLNKVMSSIKAINKGSVVHLDYLPDVGTRVVVDGQERITIPGEDFFRAMLHIWIGNKPVDGRLRDAMLGKGSGGKLF